MNVTDYGFLYRATGCEAKMAGIDPAFFLCRFPLLFCLDFFSEMWYSSGGWQSFLCRKRDGGWGIIKLFSPKITERWGFDGKR